MICYTCGKYLKKGHGKNLYYYAGQWRYYCFFCLKVSDYHSKVNSKRKEYYGGLLIFCLLLGAFLWWLTKHFTNSRLDEFWTYHLWFGTVPTLTAYILISKLVIKPKLTKFIAEEWEPLSQEEAKLRKMANYVNALNNSKSACLCERCLIEAWSKRKQNTT